MTDERDATFVHISGRVTPETRQALIEYHADRLRRGGTPRHFTASLRDVIEAGLRALNVRHDSHIATTHTDERAA